MSKRGSKTAHFSHAAGGPTPGGAGTLATTADALPTAGAALQPGGRTKDEGLVFFWFGSSSSSSSSTSSSSSFFFLNINIFVFFGWVVLYSLCVFLLVCRFFLFGLGNSFYVCMFFFPLVFGLGFLVFGSGCIVFCLLVFMLAFDWFVFSLVCVCCFLVGSDEVRK